MKDQTKRKYIVYSWSIVMTCIISSLQQEPKNFLGTLINFWNVDWKDKRKWNVF